MADYITIYENIKQFKLALNGAVSRGLTAMQHSFCLYVFSVNLSCYRSLSHEVPFSKVALQLLWAHTLKLTNWALIEGYSNVKRCTNEGRALMQLDFQIYLVEISKVCLEKHDW